jgi:dTDP-4-dehydrorhamnose reductase
MRVAVVGARGQLGAALVEACDGRHETIAFDRSTLDITDGGAIRVALQRARPDAVINCAGFNAVDAAETVPIEALRANAFAVRALARAAARVDAVLVHYSSDFVMDGTATSPVTEECPPAPRSVYASSKLLGEWFAAYAPAAYVLRVESLFGVGAGSEAKGSIEVILAGLRAGRRVRVFRDRTVSPTYVHDAAQATLSLLERHCEPGLYHCVNSGAATWFEVAAEAARLLNVRPDFEPVSVADVVFRAPRPQYSALSNAKLAAAGFAMPTWQDALRRYVVGQSYS